ncbi:hypothetical protein NDU88_005809 [Pleurodeles waltl]|uniref:Uncharacterized protein n=1 Tax=Pleurodeles waltl TaxID=8319 RepID=A0AAV7PGI1_PLEWA|nr:hypothetical protein NDU88_005809 [Pleurodeles waltl]
MTRGCDWVAIKVVIRGLCMQTIYSVRRQLEKDVLDHEAKLRVLEKCLPTQPQRMEERRQAQRSNKPYHQCLHAMGDKAAKLLACLLKQHVDHMPATAPIYVAGRRVCTQVAINKVFQDHLDKLYALPRCDPLEAGMTFLDRLPLPRLTRTARALLDAHLDWEEIQGAI